MHLIDVRSYKLKYFFTERLPPYAILSHTWGDDEVTFQEMTLDTAQYKGGFKKIAYTCQQAIKDRLEWAWVDTCCIDKTSSAELSEAINSMFSWYRTSTKCYAYLQDYEPSEEEDQVADQEASRFDEERFRSSRWFTRGWTLQELIAPKTVDFFSSSWQHFGTKATLADVIKSITNIERVFLLSDKPLSEASIAKRMSWAATRQTTRAEDVAYSLLGIFDINMPLLYGEGHKAFQRLQSEIWREYDDDTLLAWTVSHDDPRCFMPTDVFAASPMDFRNSGAATQSKPKLGEVSAVTKKGLRLDVPIFLLAIPLGSRYSDTHVFRLQLNCTVDQKVVSILAIRLQQEGGIASYARIASPNQYYPPSSDFRQMTQITTAFLSRRVPDALVASFALPKHSARVYIQVAGIHPNIGKVDLLQNPWRFVKPDARRFGRVDLTLYKLQSDMDTSLDTALHPLMAFENFEDPYFAPNVIQTLLVFNENRREGEVRNGFELRCAVQLNKDRSVYATCLDWSTWDYGTNDPKLTNLDETLGDALTRNDFLDPFELREWARSRLVELPDSASPDCLHQAQVDLGEGNMMTATLKRGSPDGIVGGIDHFIVGISFDVKKEIGPWPVPGVAPGR